MSARSESEHPLDVLTEEHAVIRAVLDAMDKELSSEEGGSLFRARWWGHVAEFFESFVERGHLTKEEDALFPLVLGLDPGKSGLIEELKKTHEEGRDLRETLGSAAAVPERDQVLASAHALVREQRDCIRREEKELFEDAWKLLGPDEVRALREKFAEVEEFGIGADSHGRYFLLARRLCREARSEFPVRQWRYLFEQAVQREEKDGGG